MNKIFDFLFFLFFISTLSCNDESEKLGSPIDKLDSVLVESDSLEFGLESDDVLFTFTDHFHSNGYVFLVDHDGNTTDAKEFVSGREINFLVGELPNPYPFDVFICMDFSSSLQVIHYEDFFDLETEFVFEDSDNIEVISTNWFEIETEKNIKWGSYNHYDASGIYNVKDGNHVAQHYDLYAESDFAFFRHRYEDSDLFYYKNWSNLSSGDTLYMTESDFSAYDGIIDLSGETGYSLNILGIKNNIKYSVDQEGDEGFVYYPTGVFDDFEVTTEYDHSFWHYYDVVTNSLELTKIDINDYQIVFNDTSSIKNFSMDALNIDQMYLNHSYYSNNGTEVVFLSLYKGTKADFSFTHFPESLENQFGEIDQLDESKVSRIILDDYFDGGYLRLIHFFDRVNTSSIRPKGINNDEKIFRLVKNGNIIKAIAQ